MVRIGSGQHQKGGMAKRKIHLPELGEMLRAGKSTQEMAEHFGVTTRAVQKAAAKFGEGVTRHVVLHHAGQKARQDLDAREQLLKINDSANRLLDLLEAQMQADQETARRELQGKTRELEDLLADGDEGERIIGEMFEVIEKFIPSRPLTIDQLFKAQAEIRQQVGLLMKVAAELLEANRVNEVHRVMLEEIGAESPECQGRIIRRLKGSNILLQAVGWA